MLSGRISCIFTHKVSLKLRHGEYIIIFMYIFLSYNQCNAFLVWMLCCVAINNPMTIMVCLPCLTTIVLFFGAVWALCGQQKGEYKAYIPPTTTSLQGFSVAFISIMILMDQRNATLPMLSIDIKLPAIRCRPSLYIFSD